MKLKVNAWAVAVIILVIVLLGWATWNYLSSVGVQFSPGDSCGDGKVSCNGKCQLTGLVCSECGTGTPFKTAAGCSNSPGKIGG